MDFSIQRFSQAFITQISQSKHSLLYSQRFSQAFSTWISQSKSSLSLSQAFLSLHLHFLKTTGSIYNFLISTNSPYFLKVLKSTDSVSRFLTTTGSLLWHSEQLISQSIITPGTCIFS